MAFYTTVTGQVLDSAGQPYANGSFSLTLVLPSGVSAYPTFIGGGDIPGVIAGGALTATGNLPTMSVPDNNQINPPGTKWQFNILDSSGLIGFTAQVTITGTSQSVTAALQAASALLGAPTITTASGYGMILAPGSRPATAYAYLVSVRDGGGSSSGLMTGGAAQKTYAFAVQVNRPLASAATGDSNDSAILVTYNNYALNDANFIMRGVNTRVNNQSGGTLGQLTGGLISASSKSGSTSPYVKGLEVNVENFGTNATEHSGVDVTLKNEGAKATLEYGIRIRNLNNSLTTACDAGLLIGTSSGLTNTGFTYGLDFNGATLAFEYRSSNGVTLKKKGTDTWDGLTLTKSTTVGPTVGNEGVALFIENNRTAIIDDQATITAVEGVARSRSSGVELTARGGHFRVYVDQTLGGTAITSVGIDGAVRGSGSVVAAAGTAFVGIRSYMSPGFTGGSVGNVTNFHAFWAYNESATQAVTNAFYASSAAGGFTNGLNLSGATIAAGGGQIIFSNGVAFFTGAAVTRNAVRAEVGTACAIGSKYFSTGGREYLKVANANAEADWERVTTTAAD